MEVVRAAYAQNTTQAITEHTRVCEMKVCEEHFISLNLKGAFEMRHSFLYFFSWVRIFCTHISRPLAYGVRISSKSSTTAVRQQIVTAVLSSKCLESFPRIPFPENYE